MIKLTSKENPSATYRWGIGFVSTNRIQVAAVPQRWFKTKVSAERYGAETVQGTGYRYYLARMA